MATFTDNQPVQFNKVKPLVDPEMYAGALAKKDSEYKEGVKKVQSYIDSVAGLPIMREQDKQYLQGLVNGISTRVNDMASGGTDWSDSKIVTSIQGHAATIYNDEKVQDAIASTAKVKSAMANAKASKEKGKDWSQANQSYLENEISQWYANPIVGKSFNSDYIPYTDVQKYALELYRNARPDLDIVEQPNGGYLAYDKVQKSYKRLDPSEVKQQLSSLIGNESKFSTQMTVNAWYKYNSYSPEDISNEVKRTYESGTRMLQKAIDDANLAKANTIDEDRLKGLNDFIKENEKRIKDLEGEKGKLQSSVLNNPDLVKGMLYKEDWLNTMSHIIGYEEESLKTMGNPALASYQRDQDLATRAKKAADATAKKVPPGDTYMNVGTPMNQKAIGWGEFQKNRDQIDKQIDEKKSRYLFSLYDKKGLTGEFFNPVQHTYDASGVQNPVHYSMRNDKKGALNDEYAKKQAKYNSGTWYAQDDNGDPLTETDIRHFDEVTEMGKKKALMDQATVRANEALNAFGAADPEMVVYDKAVNSIKYNTQTVNINGKPVSVTKEDLITAATLRQQLENVPNTEYTGQTYSFTGIPGTRQRTKDEIAADKKRIMEGAGISEEKATAILEVMRANMNNPALMTGLSALSGMDQKGISQKRAKFLNDYVRNYQAAITPNRKIIETGKAEEATSSINKVKAWYGELQSTGNKDYDADISKIFEKSPKGEGVVIEYDPGDVDGQPKIYVSHPEVESGTPYALPVSKQNAINFGFDDGKARPLADAETRLQLNNNGGYSKTGIDFNDALVFNKSKDFLIKYNIIKDDYGLNTIVYIKSTKDKGAAKAIELGYVNSLSQVQAGLQTIASAYATNGASLQVQESGIETPDMTNYINNNLGQ